ncbi:sulfate ABC transporter ATP-binding protein [Oscillatoria amoena NRMC-F 0135]|nr:sulfate ABC transporter ATP-binding protein [Oscillatoria laete-virens]MDL5048666.1 sulfate ABC transporter ATP-binding protein [Oscillatoria amoena NRMC-F 0135]MDL5053241.1 sulfate ABC transporter ATP-binding protein [Oscillatoria laete-virens NRMC-F 0139]
MSVEVKNLTKKFGSYKALNQINLKIQAGKLIALLGPSGSGKTTLLRIIAGLDFADEGSIHFNDREVTALTPKERNVGLVFQHYALFRHMTVFDNIAFGLNVRPAATRPSPDVIKQRVNELLDLVQLGQFASRYPSQLSGGQKQRIALARTLAVEPRILLLDEPFGALDAKVRKDLRRWLREFHDRMKITTIFVTHDQEEALELADEVVVMNHAKIEQIGTPEDVYDHPANPFVYEFIGSVNLFHGRINGGAILIDGKEFTLSKKNTPENVSAGVAYVRPQDIRIHTEKPSTDGALEAIVKGTTFSGASTQVHLERIDNRDSVYASLTREEYLALNPAKGQHVHITVRNAQAFTDDYSI